MLQRLGAVIAGDELTPHHVREVQAVEHIDPAVPKLGRAGPVREAWNLGIGGRPYLGGSPFDDGPVDDFVDLLSFEGLTIT